MFFFTKAKRAQNVDDYESWNEGGVAPTLNAMDNNGEAYATVLIVGVDIYNADISDKSFQTIKAGGGITSMPSVLIIDGTRVNDVRVYEDGIVPTVISRYGTGGGNVPMVFSINNATTAYKKTWAEKDEESWDETYVSRNLTVNTNSYETRVTMLASDSTVVRRLTPVECERLQGFPDNWTDGQADSNRYKQMGNAVAVPVVEWIISRMVGEDD
jgi:site-specific DNA-cytosine methylase